jgi:Type VI secretion system (T6SS), amidase effector protein 4
MTTFTTLWNNHPHVKGEDALLDKAQYENQCAINLYAAMERSGINVRSFPGQLSWQKDRPRYAIRAQEVANWLASSARPIPAKVEKFVGQEAFGEVKGRRGIKGRTGIVFFQNYWGVGAQGDHIDLWNGSRLTDMLSWVRIYARIGSLGLGTDYRKAQSVLFWAIP